LEEPEKEMNEKEDKKWVCPICDKEKSSSDKKHHYEGNEYLDINLDGTYEGFICSSCYEDLEEDLEEDYEVDETSEYSSVYLKEFDEGHENPPWVSNNTTTNYQQTSSSYVPLIDTEESKSEEPLNGQGTKTWSVGKYVGGFKDGLRHGQGTFYYTDDVWGKYVGSWKDNNQWNGIHYDKDGDIYGKFVNGEWILVGDPIEGS